MVQIDKKIFKIVTFKTIPIWKKNLMPNMSKLKKEFKNFLVKLFLDKSKESPKKWSSYHLYLISPQVE